MLIDWFTVGAQMLNFLTLVWLMKRFLYRPILHAIDEREKRIAAELAAADAKKYEAQKERDEFRHKNEYFDQQRAALLNQAISAAAAERQRLFDEARQSANAFSAQCRETLRQDANNLNQAITRRIYQEVFSIARKALMDLATTSLEERLVEVLILRLHGMESETRATLKESFKAISSPMLVRSAFDLPEAQRTAIKNALQEILSMEIQLQFETTPELISGIELASNSQKLVWSITDYLTSMEKSIDELLQEELKQRPNRQNQNQPQDNHEHPTK
jgi:F-type H+-transporting ATPase subunit b